VQCTLTPLVGRMLVGSDTWTLLHWPAWLPDPALRAARLSSDVDGQPAV